MSISLDIREWCDEADVDGNACDELRAIADRIDREIAEYERLKKENAELTAELDDWKGNAEGFQPDSYMKLPLDADGIAIRPGDKIYFSGDHESETLKCIAVGCSPYPVEFTDWEETGTTAWEEGLVFTHRQPTTVPPDSWAKMEQDAMKRSCSYFGLDLTPVSCDCCPHGWKHTGRECWQNARLDMISRAKKLAGIEEEAQR